MKQGLVTFAKGVVLLVGLAALLVCIILLPELAREESVENPESANITIPFLVTSYILATPFFIGLYQTFKLLNFIGKGKAFSNKSIKALQNIKICAIIFNVLIFIAVVSTITLVKIVDPAEDVTFIVTIGLALIFISSVLAVFVAVLQKLLSDGMILKSENDLIV